MKGERIYAPCGAPKENPPATVRIFLAAHRWLPTWFMTPETDQPFTHVALFFCLGLPSFATCVRHRMPLVVRMEMHGNISAPSSKHKKSTHQNNHIDTTIPLQLRTTPHPQGQTYLFRRHTILLFVRRFREGGEGNFFQPPLERDAVIRVEPCAIHLRFSQLQRKQRRETRMRSYNQNNSSERRVATGTERLQPRRVRGLKSCRMPHAQIGIAAEKAFKHDELLYLSPLCAD